MKNTIIYLLIFTLFLSVAYGIEDCMTLEPLTANDVPCMIITSFPYTNACNTYTIKFYNSTPSLIGETTLDSYTGTDVCNTTFNYTKVGSYTFNVSSGESGRIIVETEEDNMASFAVMFFLMVLTGTLFWLGYTKKFTNNKWSDEVIRRGIYITGILMIALLLAVSLTLSANFGLGLDNELFMLLFVAHKGAYVAMVFLFFSAVMNGLKMWKIEKQERRLGE